VVLFYENDDQLVSTVVGYLVDGLMADESAVVVASASHIEAFEAAMVQSGVDVVAARASGMWIALDASEALARFLRGDWPDAEAFDVEIGGLLRDAIACGRHVRVYGEMVALLWDAGQVAAVIELESLWNDLGRQVPFSLFCAYPSQSVVGDHHEDSFHRVCHSHSSVVGEMPRRRMPIDPFVTAPAEASRSFRCRSSALGAARQFVIDALGAWGLDGCADDASIVVSELATNALLHARSDFTVALSWDVGVVRVAVRDASTMRPVVCNPSPTTIGGRGLILISALASAWGTDLSDDGKVVWAELSL
jgi:anti-sigma regulatory factor (Ser/Thr protein kinase)